MTRVVGSRGPIGDVVVTLVERDPPQESGTISRCLEGGEGWEMENQGSEENVVTEAPVSVRLLGGFGVDLGGHQVSLPLSAQRVLVALACHPPELDRAVLGASLYPDGRRAQVSASLRSALWRVRREVPVPLVISRAQRLSLAPQVDVDLHKWSRLARRLTASSRMESSTSCPDAVAALSQELLPGWDDEWLVFERQRWDQLRLHALEHLAESSTGAGRHMESLEAALAAVAIEPYRESAHRVLIAAYLAEGNRASALAQYHRYHHTLYRELGVRPTSQLQQLAQQLTRE